MTKDFAREVAERLVILGDDFTMVLPPVAEFVAVIHDTEKELLGGNVDGIYEINILLRQRKVILQAPHRRFV